MRARPVELARSAYGLALLAAPRPALRLATGAPPDPGAVAVVRVLGARHLLQGSLSVLAEDTPQVVAVGAWVDTVHALTALGLALVDPRRARGALVDGVLASGWSLAGRSALRSAREPERPDALARLAAAVARRLPGVPPTGVP